MIASVTASEPAKAQDENREPSAWRIVIYRMVADQLPEAQVSWNGPPGRVKAPYGLGKKLGGQPKSRVVRDCSSKWEVDFS
jgi:hypothetical protein